MAVNKVELNGNTLIDLTEDTVTPQTLVIGVTTHDRSGAIITGTADYQPKSLATPVTIGSETAATVESAISAIAGIIPASASSANKTAVISDITAERISASATGSDITVTDSADAGLLGVYIKGHSEVISGEIVSIGDNGLTITTSGIGGTSISSAVITTGLPLRSFSESVYDELDSISGKVITRCGIENGEVIALAVPVTTPLTSAEIASLNTLRTYIGTTDISATDSPEITVEYIKNTADGNAVSLLSDRIPKILDATCTLSAASWIGASAPYTQTAVISGITSDIVPIIAPSLSDTVATGLEQQTEWTKITKAVSDTDNITFMCYEDKPTVDLTAIVKVV